MTGKKVLWEEDGGGEPAAAQGTTSVVQGDPVVATPPTQVLQSDGDRLLESRRTSAEATLLGVETPRGVQRAVPEVDDRGYVAFFEEMTGQSPHPWQRALGETERCEDRLLRIPTGFGKTAGAVLPWLYQRVIRGDRSWPTRLLFVLPMRVLAEQTVRVVTTWVATAGLTDDVGVHLAMGGVDAGDFHLHPERPAILVGTQDMWLSRALMRGFASGRARWPMDFGLMHHDTLWVLDEVQLMDVGLATTSQLAALREKQPSLRPAYSWWMSATLQPGWLATHDARTRTAALAERVVSIPAAERSGALFDVTKSVVRRDDLTAPEEVAAMALEAHAPASLTLVIANTVDRASAMAAEVEKRLSVTTGSGKNKTVSRRADAPDVRLVHSRFRGHERARWDFLTRDACTAAALPAGGRIVIATQVVEAGVDVSAAALVTDLAPWPSLVQRFGRCARYAGESGSVTVVGSAEGKAAEKVAGPYEVTDLQAAAHALTKLGTDAAPRSIEALEERLSDDERSALYRYEPFHVLRRADLDALFDTSKDLSGGDIDPSRFIRSGEDRDVTVLWRHVTLDDAAPLPTTTASTEADDDETDGAGGDENAETLIAAPRAKRQRSRALTTTEQPLATRDELCRVPVGDARKWLGECERFWVFDYLDGAWRSGNARVARQVTPSDVVLVEAREGGYAVDRGFDAKSKAAVPVVPRAETSEAERAFEETAASEGDDTLSETAWQTIATHGAEVAAEVTAIATRLGLDASFVAALQLAARWHDVGKAHETFQAALLPDTPGRPARTDLAKAPSGAWRRPAYPQRPGFRHELASLLALYETLACVDPDHAALADELAGQWREDDEEIRDASDVASAPEQSALTAELAAMDADMVDLVAWCVVTHHGKVRCALASTPHDQVLRPEERRIHGVRSGDVLPPTTVATAGGPVSLPATMLDLEMARLGNSERYGRSWADRVAGLRERHGPFVLAYLEALLRAADVRASMRVVRDALLDPREGGAE